MTEVRHAAADAIVDKLTAYRLVDTAILSLTDVNAIYKIILQYNAGEAVGLTAGQIKTAVDSAIALQEAALSGKIATLGSITGGTLYTNGTYTSVPLTGGTGTGAIATITVAGATVTTVTITSAGVDYTVGDSMSALAENIGGTGSGFTVPVLTLTV